MVVGDLGTLLGGCGWFRYFSGWLWVVVARCGWLWLVVGGCGSLWVVVARCGSLWLVAYFSNTQKEMIEFKSIFLLHLDLLALSRILCIL